MHGEHENSRAPRVVCTLIHGAFLAMGGWIYFANGGAQIYGWLGIQLTSSASVARRIILFSFGCILFARMCFALFHLLRRKFGWDELFGVLFALMVYQVGFAVIGIRCPMELGSSDGIAILLFLVGSYFNTGAEWQRKKFKDDPANAGHLYSQGLFRYARHINYFGDVLWVSGWALITRNLWAIIVPISLSAGFVFFFIPSLSKHLDKRYGEEYRTWSKRTKALIPFIY